MSHLSFKTLGLSKPIYKAVEQLGYETPSPIQAESIPLLIEGRDILAQAQTGTGKTAAFSLPIIQEIDTSLNTPQALILAPTRELAIQVAEAFQSYAKNIPEFRVAAIFGGQDYKVQLKALKRGAHVVVGTPGRLMDHLRRKTLSIDNLSMVVLDEADEMLNMGFVDDIEWILDQISGEHQTALFSATMPESIKKISKKYLNNPEHIKIKAEKKDVQKIEQSYMCIPRDLKLEVLTRYLDVEDTDAVMIFSRTKSFASELAQKLQARGYATAALHGDMSQSLRTQVVESFKNKQIDILIATDVAARGIDIDRVSHVVNYDIPTDSEPYTHRIGRTGRAGRSGKALSIIVPREYHLLKEIERETGNPIQKIDPPSVKRMQDKRCDELKAEILQLTVGQKELIEPYIKLIESLESDSKVPVKDIAAALAYLTQASNPLSTREIYSSAPEKQKQRPNNNKSRSRSRSNSRSNSGSRSNFKSRDQKRNFKENGGNKDKKRRSNNFKKDGRDFKDFKKSRNNKS